ncbi:MAG: YihY/virulence factor BrkB family protein [Nitrolancea sp.]
MMTRRLRLGLGARLTRLKRIYAVDVLSRAYSQFSNNHGSIYAAAVTYYVIFSMFPLLIFLVAVFGLIVHDPDSQTRLVNEIMRQIPQALKFRSEVQDIISGVASTQNGLVGLVGVAGLVWTASGMFGALRRALNNAFDVESSRSFVRGRSMDILSVLAVLVGTLLSVVLSTALGVFRAISDDLFHGVLVNIGWGALYLLLPLAVSWSVFFATYRWVPNHSLSRRDLWFGALLAAVGFELAKAGFGLYLTKFAHYSEVYGTLGGVVAFMFFIYLVSNVVIFGAELSSELAKDNREKRRQFDTPAVT